MVIFQSGTQEEAAGFYSTETPSFDLGHLHRHSLALKCVFATIYQRMKWKFSPVEAATAPTSAGGIPRKMTTPAAMKQIILAVAVELEDRVL